MERGGRRLEDPGGGGRVDRRMELAVLAFLETVGQFTVVGATVGDTGPSRDALGQRSGHISGCYRPNRRQAPDEESLGRRQSSQASIDAPCKRELQVGHSARGTARRRRRDGRTRTTPDPADEVECIETVSKNSSSSEPSEELMVDMADPTTRLAAPRRAGVRLAIIRINERPRRRDFTCFLIALQSV